MSDHEDDKTRTPPKKIKRYCSFDKRWMGQFSWLTEVDVSRGKCKYCRSVITIKYEVVRALENHAKSANHQKCIRAAASSSSAANFFIQRHTDEELLVSATELTQVYHGVVHHFSYLAQDCTSKLNIVLYSDSKIAAKVRCGRTKATSIAENVLAPKSQEMLLSDLRESKYFSIGSDASNKGNIKMFPLIVQYFKWSKGIKQGVLDFYNDQQETSEAIYNKIKEILLKNDLDIKNVSSYSADNAAVNYGKNVSVFQKLASDNTSLIKSNCQCHVIHNSVKTASKAFKFDVEAFVIKVFNEFSSFSKRTEKLKSFFEFVDIEYKTLLRHVPTRWLTLYEALDRLLNNWPAVKSYFVSEGEENCTPFLWKVFKENDDDSFYLCIMYFFQNVMFMLQKVLLQLENNKTTAIELDGILNMVKENISQRLTDNFYGSMAAQILKRLNANKKIEFEKCASKFYNKVMEYINKYYDFNGSIFKQFDALNIRKEFSWEKILNLARILKDCLGLNLDDMYEDFCSISRILNQNLNNIKIDMKEDSLDVTWTKCFKFLSDNEIQAKELKRLDWSVKYEQDGPVQPRFEINAPDLYIPTMAYITYVLIAGMVLGMQERFSPEQLGILASSALAWCIVELVVYSCTLYLIHVETSLSTLDLLAYIGYKFVGTIMSIAVYLVGGKTGYYSYLIYANLALAFFLIRSLKAQVLSEPNTQQQNSYYGEQPVAGNKRRLYFLLFVAATQPMLSWWLSFHLLSGPTPKVATPGFAPPQTSAFIRKHLILSANICFYPRTSAFICRNLILSENICFYPKTSAFIRKHLLLSANISFYPQTSAFIRFHPQTCFYLQTSDFIRKHLLLSANICFYPQTSDFIRKHLLLSENICFYPTHLILSANI
ncbi:unnamed protein product [Brassicogethes aeneus]|uniref:Uncharacterized protein n=1 Tax=Brassicogethes aeneus TaxID=1431903 RepID=A0A9P0FDD9_BRAAE|nr:unnamed protein product [Brassicogethes aeneus]